MDGEEGSEGCNPAAVFVSCSSAKDPTWAERFGPRSAASAGEGGKEGEGRCSVTVIAPMDFAPFAEYDNGSRVKHRGLKYDAVKERLTALLLEVLHGVCPVTRGKRSSPPHPHPSSVTQTPRAAAR